MAPNTPTCGSSRARFAPTQSTRDTARFLLLRGDGKPHLTGLSRALVTTVPLRAIGKPGSSPTLRSISDTWKSHQTKRTFEKTCNVAVIASQLLKVEKKHRTRHHVSTSYV